jgi:putative endonuclease
MSFYTYVLYSENFNKIYIGQSSDLEKRFWEHNNGFSKYTKRYIPWKIIYKETFESRSEAMKREKELKSQKGREYIWQLLNGGVRQLTD